MKINNIDKKLENWFAMYTFLQRHMKYIKSHLSKYTIIRTELLFYSIEHNLYTYCDHEIVHDYIDLFPDKYVKIKYCSKCSVTII